MTEKRAVITRPRRAAVTTSLPGHVVAAVTFEGMQINERFYWRRAGKVASPPAGNDDKKAVITRPRRAAVTTSLPGHVVAAVTFAAMQINERSYWRRAGKVAAPPAGNDGKKAVITRPRRAAVTTSLPGHVVAAV